MRFRILGLGVMWGGNEHLDQWSGPRNFSLGARVRSSKWAFFALETKEKIAVQKVLGL